MRNFCNRFIIIITTVLCISPIASQAEALDSDQLNKRLAELRLEYQRIDTDITAMARFIGKVKEDRASIDTLTNFLNRLSVVSKEIDSLSKHADAIKIKESSFFISKMWATDTLKSSESLSAITEGEATYLYIAFQMPEALEAVDIAFTVTDLKRGKEVAAVNRSRPRKGTDISQRTGIKIEAGDLQAGTNYEWHAILTTANGKSTSKKMQFGYGQVVVPLGEITLIASDGETGQPLGANIADDALLKLKATIPLIEVGEGEITWQLSDSIRQPIESMTKVESINEVGGNKQSTFEIHTQALPPGQYTASVVHSLKENSKSRSERTLEFNVMGALNIHKLAVSNSTAGDITSGTLKAGDMPHLFVHYTALKPVKKGSLRIVDAKNGKAYYSSDITERVNPDRKPHRIGTRLSADLLPLDREVIFEVSFRDINDNDIGSKRPFRINRHKLAIKLAKKLKSGKDYNFSITPPPGFVSPYTVIYQPSSLLVHENRNNPLAGSVTGITEAKKKSAGLKVELTDANGQVAVAYRELIVIGSRPAQPIKQPRAIPTQKSASGDGDLFASLWGYKEGDYLKDPIIKQLGERIRGYGGDEEYFFPNCLPVMVRHYLDHDDAVSPDRTFMGDRQKIRKIISNKQTKCSNGKPYYSVRFKLEWDDFPQKPVRGYEEFGLSYSRGCRPHTNSQEDEYHYMEYDGGYSAEFFKTFTSDDADSVVDMIVMTCLAPSKFLKKFIPEAPTHAIRPMGCRSVEDDRKGFNSYKCRMPLSKLPKKLW